jgi:hypothetical protein
MKKNLRYVAIAFLVFYLVTKPTNAADVVNRAFGALASAGDSMGQFMGQLGK